MGEAPFDASLLDYYNRMPDTDETKEKKRKAKMTHDPTVAGEKTDLDGIPFYADGVLRPGELFIKLRDGSSLRHVGSPCTETDWLRIIRPDQRRVNFFACSPTDYALACQWKSVSKT